MDKITKLIDSTQFHKHLDNPDMQVREVVVGQLNQQLNDLKIDIEERIEELKIGYRKKELEQERIVDELERLENMGELMVFSDIPTADYLIAAHPEEWKLKSKVQTYHPVGTEEYEKDYLEEHKQGKKWFRMITEEEAHEMVDRLSKRKEHPKDCKCEVCQPHGATNHIKSFAVKPFK